MSLPVAIGEVLTMAGPPRSLAAALTGLGALLCVLGWYQASGQPTVPQQIPYLASATIPGAALLAAGAAALLRSSAAGERAPGRVPEASPAGGRGGAIGAQGPFLQVPDGRYLHAPDCPLLDGRADVVVLDPAEAAAAGLRPCPLCHASPAAPDSDAATVHGTGAAAPAGQAPGTGADGR
jgi:hypothetical protein